MALDDETKSRHERVVCVDGKMKATLLLPACLLDERIRGDMARYG